MMICTIERVLPNTLYNDLCRAYEMQRYTRGLWNCGNCARNVKWKRNANVSTTYLIMYLILFLSCITTLVYTVSVWSHFVETHEWDFVDHYTSSWRLIAIHPVELAQEGHASLHIRSESIYNKDRPFLDSDVSEYICVLDGRSSNPTLSAPSILMQQRVPQITSMPALWWRDVHPLFDRELEARGDHWHALLISSRPRWFGHGLFVPSLLQGAPHAIIKTSMLAALQLVAMASYPGFRLGFSSLGSPSTVDHMHWHVGPLGEVLTAMGGAFPCERTVRIRVDLPRIDPADEHPVLAAHHTRDPTQPPLTCVPQALRLSRSADGAWPLPFIVVETPGDPIEMNPPAHLPGTELASRRLVSLSHAVAGIACYLTRTGTPHHVIVAEGGRTVLIVPLRQKYSIYASRGALLDSTVDMNVITEVRPPRAHATDNTELGARSDAPRPGAMHSFAESCGLVVALTKDAFVDLDDDGFATALASAALERAEFERFVTEAAREVSAKGAAVCPP